MVRDHQGVTATLLAECDKHSNPMLGQMVRVALYTGMRLGEIGTLRLNQIDLANRFISLSVTKNGTARTVPLSKRATEVLATAVANPARPKDTDLVFFGEKGRDGKRKYYRFEKQWNQTKKDSGVHDFHYHDLRHEAISRWVEAGLDSMEVAAVSGHKSMQMLKRYMHLRTKNLVQKLDDSGVQ
jgi:integrase